MNKITTIICGMPLSTLGWISLEKEIIIKRKAIDTLGGARSLCTSFPEYTGCSGNWATEVATLTVDIVRKSMIILSMAPIRLVTIVQLIVVLTRRSNI